MGYLSRTGSLTLRGRSTQSRSMRALTTAVEGTSAFEGKKESEMRIRVLISLVALALGMVVAHLPTQRPLADIAPCTSCDGGTTSTQSLGASQASLN